MGCESAVILHNKLLLLLCNMLDSWTKTAYNKTKQEKGGDRYARKRLRWFSAEGPHDPRAKPIDPRDFSTKRLRLAQNRQSHQIERHSPPLAPPNPCITKRKESPMFTETHTNLQKEMLERHFIHELNHTHGLTLKRIGVAMLLAGLLDRKE